MNLSDLKPVPEDWPMDVAPLWAISRERELRSRAWEYERARQVGEAFARGIVKQTAAMRGLADGLRALQKSTPSAEETARRFGS